MAQNRFLDERWQQSHLKQIRQQAGGRYSPELNVDLPITGLFDGLTRNENFYSSIRRHCGKLNRGFKRVSSKYKNDKHQLIYSVLRNEISQLSMLLNGIKKYDTDQIPWVEINNRTHRTIELARNLSESLRTSIDDPNSQVPEPIPQGQRPDTEIWRYDIYSLQETLNELSHFEDLSVNSESKLSNSPFLLLTGRPGTGKTHLLCDVIENRFAGMKKLPAVLVFGELFDGKIEPFAQIIQQLDMRLSNEQFLTLLNNAGKRSNCRAILAIDALNETKLRNYWKRNLSKVENAIREYPNIALVVSVRSGFEAEVLTKLAHQSFIQEEHRGFEFHEWDAIKIFFTEYKLPLPEIPVLTPEFQNPLFLLLFCKAFEKRTGRYPAKRQKQIFRGHEGATYIFETFVDSVSRKITKQFKIDTKARKNIWDTVIEKIAAEMVELSSDRISQDRLTVLVKNAYPSIDHENFIIELERNSLLVKIPNFPTEKNTPSAFSFRFPFQKFSDHLIGRYIFKKYENEFGVDRKNLETAKIYFSKRRRLGKFLSNSWNRGIIEALSIQCPEHLNGCEFVEVAPYFRKSRMAQQAFVESLIWRKPTAFSVHLENTLAYINAEIVKSEIGRENLLNAFLAVAPVANHPFNSDFLHKNLSKYSMANRDHSWSTFLHYQNSERGAVDRLIEWCWSDQDLSRNNNETTRLCSAALIWFLSTPNRSIRDRSTKALVVLLTNKLDVLLILLKQFKDVNDPYISERLYGITYGCAIRTHCDKEQLAALSLWVYREIFQDGNPPENILLRDYARGIIEVALHKKIQLRINRKKIEPPYGSHFPKRFPSNLVIENYEFNYKRSGFKDLYWAQNSIIASMQPEHSEISNYGDFGRYTFEHSLSQFNFPENITMQKLSNWATKRVFDLGFDVNLHGSFDCSINRHSDSGRSGHKAERIGKKYQWIAMHELLAKVSDNFKLESDIYSGKFKKFQGLWPLYVRDIDPTCVLKAFPNTRPPKLPSFESYKIKNVYNARSKKTSDSTWLRNPRDLPNPKQSIECIDDQGIVWLALEGLIKWREEILPENESYDFPNRELWYMTKSYLVKESEIDQVFKWAKRQRLSDHSMPESLGLSNVFLGEFPWAPAFLYFNIPYYHHDGWTDGTSNGKIPVKILVTDDQYSSSGTSIDCSTDATINMSLPAKWITDKMNLSQNYVDGRFFNRNGELVAFDPSVFDSEMPGRIFVRKDLFCNFLNRKGYSIFWTLFGEKYLTGDLKRRPLGMLQVHGAYSLGRKNRLIGRKSSLIQEMF